MNVETGSTDHYTAIAERNMASFRELLKLDEHLNALGARQESVDELRAATSRLYPGYNKNEVSITNAGQEAANSSAYARYELPPDVTITDIRVAQRISPIRAKGANFLKASGMLSSLKVHPEARASNVSYTEQWYIDENGAINVLDPKDRGNHFMFYLEGRLARTAFSWGSPENPQTPILVPGCSDMTAYMVDRLVDGRCGTEQVKTVETVPDPNLAIEQVNSLIEHIKDKGHRLSMAGIPYPQPQPANTWNLYAANT